MAQLPQKPQPVIIERWLPYEQQKRKVIFNRSSAPQPAVVKPRNLIIQWEAPKVEIKQEIKYLGVVRADPVEYLQKYGDSLKVPSGLPKYVLDITTPEGLGKLAAEHRAKHVHELEGQLDALKYVDLDKEDLSEYQPQLVRLGIVSASSASSSSIVRQIFEQIDRDGNGYLTLNEARSVFIKINSRLGRRNEESEVNFFFKTLNTDVNGKISLKAFQTAFDKMY